MNSEIINSEPLSLTYLDPKRIALSKVKLSDLEGVYLKALQQVVQNADGALSRKPNPVTNKLQPGPSGDQHDYYSIGPYWWPDNTQPDGLPWIRRDGEVNPLARGDDTDKVRSKTLLYDLGHLNIAYIFTNKADYLNKTQQLVFTWMIDPVTKMNPNLDYAQGVPGASTGRPYGIIEWEKISNVVTSVELLEQSGTVNKLFIEQANAWLNDYLTWLLTSEIGIQEGATLNNHATWYDFQVIGLMIHLNQIERAKAYASDFKSKRIDSQIERDGAQPQELARTKSVSYSSMNLMAFLKVADLSRRLGIDLLNYEGEEGQSISAAVNYLLPYVHEQKQWEYQQIGGIKKALQEEVMSTLYVAFRLFENELVPQILIEKNYQHIEPEIILTF
ncbi:MAG: alginate lyase family protein [Paraglaciecola sp.]|nr:alginate lyase family protein [Paraglaciecola sp.]